MEKINFRTIRNEYIRRSMRYADGVRMLYDQALSDVAREFALVDYNTDVLFSFSNYGKFGRVDSIMSRLEEQIQAVINVGIENEFGIAYDTHNDLLKQILGDNISYEMERAFAPRITSGNAAKLFISETASNNITRSMRVWNGASLGQMETAVQEALMDGMPAKQMAGLIEQYLNDPESCFKRFRIKTGVDADGKSMYGRKWMKRVRNEDGSTSWFDADPRDYPTGQGVYHSSYKNALRYTRTTTNIAYRTADYERYQTEDFVLGIEIHTTSNPTHKEDICDFLAGRYPKDFKWVGWHINCLCYQVPILATPDEVNAMADAIMNDQDPSTVPVDERVTDVPDNFKQWVEQNENRMIGAKSMPYFLRDNTGYVCSVLGDTKASRELIEKYGITGAKPFINLFGNNLFSDVTGGISTTTLQGITSLINKIYLTRNNSERVSVLKQIIADKGFERMSYHSTKNNSIYSMGMKLFDKELKAGEMPENLVIAKKMVNNGYDVFLLPNPKSVSADFIFRKKNKLFYYEGKTLNGKNSLDHRLNKAAVQADRVVVNIIGTNDARYISREVRKAIEKHKNLSEIILLKGARLIILKRHVILSEKFVKDFLSIWNMAK